MEDSKISVVFCSSCSEKLLQVFELRTLCQISIQKLEQSLIDVKIEEDQNDLKDVAEDSDEMPDIQEEPTKQSKQKSEIFECSTCGHKVMNKRSLSIHIKTKHMGAFCCRMCKKAFYDADEYKRHIAWENEKHGIGPKGRPKRQRFGSRFECHFCGQVLQTRRTINIHIHTKHLGAHSCRECKKIFYDTAEFNEHVKLENEKRQEGKHVCHHCGKVCRWGKSQLTSHIAEHQ